MLKYRNFGKKSLDVIKAKLGEMCMNLGMSLKDEVRAALDEFLESQDKD
jgi:DNA-directed RNA polymerase alpha subunit